jgi:hypothetical protein
MTKPVTFVLSSTSRSADDFATLADQGKRLQARGPVQMHVASVSGRSHADIPPGGSPWHDYTSYLPSLEKFFPHDDLAPFLNAEYVAKNQRLLREKLTVLRRHKMAAAAHFHLPWHLPEAFFAKFPKLRGPRIDHPRRTRREAFAMCVDGAEGKSFYAQMFGRFAAEVPELATVQLASNDAGGGFCWADWLYSGPNGPVRCRHGEMGPRVKGLIDALAGAAPKHDLDFDIRGNFSDAELANIARHHSDRFVSRAQHSRDPRHIHVGSQIDSPVLGIFNPVAILNALELAKSPAVNKVYLSFSANYSRGHERFEVSEKVIELVDAFFADPKFGLLKRLEFLRSMCGRWVGDDQADALLEAFFELNEAYNFRAAAVPLFSSNYVALSNRHINRPLVPMPEKLTWEEESYWLPHVFNPSFEEARNDYIDLHGSRVQAPISLDDETKPRVKALDTAVSRFNGVADRLAPLKGPGAGVFHRMAASLRIYASFLRSAGNFFGVQKIRDRNKDTLAPGSEPRTHPKVGHWTGDLDLQYLNEFMRDELDNTVELTSLLENGGTSQVLTADRPEDEDVFLLGPNLVSQLKLKAQIMRRHWTDAERYLMTPHK